VHAFDIGVGIFRGIAAHRREARVFNPVGFITTPK
jgi:hypothetical protein